MDDRLQILEERLTFLLRHVEEQDREMMALSRALHKCTEKLARLEGKATDHSDPGPPADQRPPHW